MKPVSTVSIIVAESLIDRISEQDFKMADINEESLGDMSVPLVGLLRIPVHPVFVKSRFGEPYL